jgi:hypothetical protein
VENRSKPGLAKLSRLVAGHSKVRITPAIRIQRVLAVACSETSRTAAILQHDVDIIILESATVKAALESALPQHSTPHFIVASDFSVSMFGDIGVRKIIDDRRSS